MEPDRGAPVRPATKVSAASVTSFVKKIINGLCHLGADAGHALKILAAGARHSLGRTEVLQQRTFACWADTGDFVERVDAQRLAALGTMGADGKAVSLVAQTLHEVKHRVARLQQQGPVAAG